MTIARSALIAVALVAVLTVAPDAPAGGISDETCPNVAGEHTNTCPAERSAFRTRSGLRRAKVQDADRADRHSTSTPASCPRDSISRWTASSAARPSSPGTSSSISRCASQRTTLRTARERKHRSSSRSRFGRSLGSRLPPSRLGPRWACLSDSGYGLGEVRAYSRGRLLQADCPPDSNSLLTGSSRANRAPAAHTASPQGQRTRKAGRSDGKSRSPLPQGSACIADSYLERRLGALTASNFLTSEALVRLRGSSHGVASPRGFASTQYVVG